MKKVCLLVLASTLVTLAAYAQTPTYKVYSVKFAESGYPFKVSDWALNGSNEPVKIDFMVWLIRGSNGKNILVDAGFLGDIEDAKDFQLKTYRRPDSALLKLGVKPGDITDIILSHPHWDHIDGLGLFPNATVWMQKQDYEFFTGAAWQKPGEAGGFAKRDVINAVNLNLAGRLKLVDGDDKEIIKGMRVYTGSRHTYNSQYVLVNTGSNKVILASDNIWVYYSLQHLVPSSAGGTLDPAGYVKAMERMKTLVGNPKFIIPGHDDRQMEIFPKVAEDIVEIR
ncbi:glyoxylase-like metal-dependent hydrolase (beta-lactamase superfamily II) [Mucilaginibacter oryzae]|uniref:Glyoxylase-like metal-dependent hydrolase (Beta-lactamase superfamily II) n=1 Tax=Mucilaginibacter oryzae TaxID=468058 RepID=A0A316HDI2_9SPHI|nr:N-acyl homoserine lactonase family protein [Mucilaginibacter oryzae]PWK79214.1 glyoxylase-like metal-dependent hydrolase (beta-lactamase superfamily II) [Mucilaginibacter oryzae]